MEFLKVPYLKSNLNNDQETLESMLQSCPKPQQEKKPRPADEQALKCPRCDSTNTKFCYYNNYSLSQPRYFCKSCRRYWTKGGTLRNVPVGGGCRRNKRSSSSSTSTTTSSSSTSKRSQDHSIPSPIGSYDRPNDLSRAIARLQQNGQLGLGFDENQIWGNPQIPDVLGINGFLEINPPSNGFHNLYYGMENGGGMMGISGSQEIGIPFEGFGNASANTSVKQEVCNGETTRALWGFPWQNNVGDAAEFDQGRLGWNGIGSWNGLLMSNIN